MKARAFGPLAIFLAAVAAPACGLDAAVLALAPTLPDGADGGADAERPDALDGSTSDAFDHGDASGIFAGQVSTCAASHGTGYCWGNNAAGALGTGDVASHLSPAPIATPIGFAIQSIGLNHACGIEPSARRAYCWGSNVAGQLGIGTTQPSLTPTLVASPSSVLALSTGYSHTCAVLTDGSLFCWGDNSEGQLGQNDAVGAPNELTPTRVGNDTDWLAIAAGQGHTCGIRAPGTLWCWGRNTNLELGLGLGHPGQIRVPTQVGTATTWSRLHLGQDDACALRRDGTLFCWGDNAEGQLGQPGNGIVGAPTQVGTDTDWAELAIETFSTCAVKTGGTLWCWGRNQEGQLGTGDTVGHSAPTQVAGQGWEEVSVGRFFACATQTSGAFYCTGANADGELGLGDVARRNTFTRVTVPAP